MGAYGGSRELMRNIAPTGPIYQAGTLSGNPLAMTAGLLTLRRLRDKTIYERLEQRSARLCEGLSKAAADAGIETITNRVGSMWTSFFTDEPVTNWATANKSNRELYGKFFHAMLNEGVYLAPSQFEAGFVSVAHTDEIIDQTIAAARRVRNWRRAARPLIAEAQEEKAKWKRSLNFSIACKPMASSRNLRSVAE